MCSGNKQDKSSAGFTIVELIMATAVFSVVLLVATTGIIKIGQTYYKNLTENKIQEATRTIVDDLSQTIQFANGTFRTGSGPNQFCIGDVRYTFNLNSRIVAGTPAQALIQERITPATTCNGGASTSSRELLADNMRLLRFSVAPLPTDAKTWQIQVAIAYGEDDLLTSYNDDGTPNGWSVPTDPVFGNATCKSGYKGGSFCATSRLDTLVKKRLN